MAKTVKVVRGSVLTTALYHRLKDDTDIIAGDLVRINNAGEIELASADNTDGGAVHGIALQNGGAVATEDGMTLAYGDLFPIAVFNSDTVLAIPLPADDNWGDMENIGVGTTAVLDVTSGAMTLTDVVADGPVLITGLPSDDQSFDPDQGDTVDNGYVYCKVPQAVLDGRGDPA